LRLKFSGGEFSGLGKGCFFFSPQKKKRVGGEHQPDWNLKKAIVGKGGFGKIKKKDFPVKNQFD